MSAPTAIYNRFDAVIVPFPFSGRGAAKRRPALILSSPEFHARNQHAAPAMIASRENPPWWGDGPISSADTGLKAASVVRMELFALDLRLIARRAGVLSEAERSLVRAELRRMLAE